MLKLMGKIFVGVCLVALGYFLHLAMGLGDEPTMGGPPGKGGHGGGRPPWMRGQSGGSDGGPTSRPREGGVPVVVAASILTSVEERVLGSGVLEAERQVTVTARVEGEVDALFVEEGDFVDSGGTLCSIDRQNLEIAQALAAAQNERDTAEYARQMELQKSNIASETELDTAKYAARISETNLEKAALDLSHSTPLAPFSGVIVRRYIEKGQLLRPGDMLFDIGDFDPLRIRIFLPATEVRSVVVGQRAELRESKESPPTGSGVVERISPVVDRESLTVEVLISFRDVPDEIRPGSFAHVDVITRTHEDVVLVPRAAVLRGDDSPHVFRVEGEFAQRIEVSTGYEDESVIVIQEGLRPGDEVIVEGNRELEDHTRIKIYRRIPVRGETVKVSARKTG